jgi:tetratricopeptide (TPR) repeat protein
MAGPASLLLRYAHFYEARRYNDLAEALIDPDSPPGTTARLLSQTASLVKQTDVHRALDLNTRAAALYRQIGDDARADPLRSNGNILDMLGRYAEAKQSLLEAREVFANSGRQKNLCRVNVNLGALAVKTGDLSDAEEWFGQALAIAKAINEPSFEAAVGCAVAELEFQLGNTDRAIKLGLESLSGLRRANWLPFISSGLANLASYLLAQRRVAEARTFAAENFELTRVLGGLHLFVCLWSWAWIGALENRFAEAALILGFVEAGYIRSGLAIKCTEQFVREQIRGLLDPALPEAEIQARHAEGGAWTEQEAASFVGSRLIGSQPHAVSIRTP